VSGTRLRARGLVMSNATGADSNSMLSEIGATRIAVPSIDNNARSGMLQALFIAHPVSGGA
jgi:hypothetical protein